jgi:group I intron endonuclease
MFILYKITNSINDKAYYGQTSQSLNKRWSGHKTRARQGKRKTPLYTAMRKHGIGNFRIEQITTVETFQEANELEIKLIRENKSLISQTGYNCSTGGQEKWKQAIVISKTEGHKKKLKKAHNKFAKPIVQFDWKTGEIIQVWESGKEVHRAGYNRSNVIAVCKREKGFDYVYDFGWCYKSFWDSVEDKSVFANPNASPQNGLRINCYTKKGEFVREFSSIREAARETGGKATAIGNCLKGRSKSSGGYKWSYVGEE